MSGEQTMSRPVTPEYSHSQARHAITKQREHSLEGRMESDAADLDKISS